MQDLIKEAEDKDAKKDSDVPSMDDLIEEAKQKDANKHLKQRIVSGFEFSKSDLKARVSNRSGARKTGNLGRSSTQSNQRLSH